jgi:glycosyltransferase involved in cell wall biosynthesis
MTKKNKIVVVTPAYNEERTVGNIVQTVLRNREVARCIVVDDGSNDQTADIAANNGALVIRNTLNVGSGASIAVGLRFAEKENADIVVLMDSDGQHDPKEIKQLVRGVQCGADYVIASRYICSSKSVTSLLRRIGTTSISWWIYLWYGSRIYDPTSGYRALSKKAQHYLVDHYPTRFSEPEVLLDILKKGFVIKEIPSEMKPRVFGKSSISVVKAIGLMIYIFIETMRRKHFAC